MDRRERPIPVSAVRPGLSARQNVRKKRYFWLMGTCITLIVVAWTIVRLFSTPLAIGMSVVAMVIPPIAAIVANPISGD